jgi:hypothetical protein
VAKRQVPHLLGGVDWLSHGRGLLPKLNISSQRLDGKERKVQHFYRPLHMLDRQNFATLFISSSIRPSLSLQSSSPFGYHGVHPQNICDVYALARSV